MSEVLLNIMSNAVKYTPDGGSIHLTIDELESDDPNYSKIRTTVKDTGIGMSKEYLPHIFDEFTREKNSTTSGIMGTGLGMPIVKKLIELMGGEISVESELGKGTTFTFVTSHRIAQDVKHNSNDNDSSLSVDNFKGKRILMAEDNELNAEIAITILEEEGFIVEHAKNGEECLDMLLEKDSYYYDLILMDVQMPILDGYEATKLIRKVSDEAKSNIPIIAMTANAFDEDKKNAFDAGMNAHVAKPIEMAKLKEALTRVLSKLTYDEEYKMWYERSYECDAFADFEEKYRQMGLTCGRLVYEAAGEGKILYADNTLVKMFGCKDYDEFYRFVGGSFKSMVYHEDLEKVDNEINEQIKASNAFVDQVQYRIKTIDNRILQVDDIGRKLYIQNGKAVFYVSIVDIDKLSKI